jgi:hypothetical protein
MPSFISIGAIISTMVFSVILGFVWYGPLFGKAWMTMSGVAMPTEKPGFAVMVKPMILSFIGSILLSYVLGFSIFFHNAYYGTMGLSPALSIAFLVWLGFIVPAYLNLKGWEGKPWKLFWINTGYWLVFLLASATFIVLI